MLETFRVHSVEALLDPGQLATVTAVVGAALERRRDEFAVGQRNRSVHEIPGLDVARTVAVYEPAGRVEFDEVPAAVGELVSAAVHDRLAEVRRVYPSVTRAGSWFYAEYGPGQYITPHVDYPVDDDVPDIIKYAAISVTLTAPSEGGEFYVATSSAAAVWDGSSAARGIDNHSEWFQAAPRTEWTVRPRAGDALCWGTQVIHGTRAVTAGTAAKLIGFLY